MFGFTWADFFAGYQEAGQAAIDIGGVLVGVGVVAVLSLLAFGWALMAAAGRADRLLEIAREREERGRHGGAIPDFDGEINAARLPFTNDVPFAGDAGWPERRAS